IRFGDSRFQVPNEQLQQDAGQLQTRTTREISGQASYQRIVSDDVLVDGRVMVRDLSAGLASNAAATPVIARQDRGIRDVYVKGALSRRSGIHEWKMGGDFSTGTVRERFDYAISDTDQFDAATPPAFAFSERGTDREHSLFIQDRLSLSHWTINAGVRWD